MSLSIDRLKDRYQGNKSVVKIIKLEPIGTKTAIITNSNLLSALLQEELKVLRVCGGRGLCATCHIYVKEGMDSLSPMTAREQRTLGIITSCRFNSRLACQTQVMDEGVVIELPSGMYINEVENLEDLIGRRAQKDILHPLSGKVLVEEGKLITRSTITLLHTTKSKVDEFLYQTQEA
jgi:ferredoxin